MAYKLVPTHPISTVYPNKPAFTSAVNLQSTGIASQLEACYIFQDTGNPRPATVNNLIQNKYNITMQYGSAGGIIKDGGFQSAFSGAGSLSTSGVVSDIDTTWSDGMHGLPRLIITDVTWIPHGGVGSTTFILECFGFSIYRTSTTRWEVRIETPTYYSLYWTVDLHWIPENKNVTIAVLFSPADSTSRLVIDGIDYGLPNIVGDPYALTDSFSKPAITAGVCRPHNSAFNSPYTGKMGLLAYSGNLTTIPTLDDLKAITLDPYYTLFDIPRPTFSFGSGYPFELSEMHDFWFESRVGNPIPNGALIPVIEYEPAANDPALKNGLLITQDQYVSIPLVTLDGDFDIEIEFVQTAANGTILKGSNFEFKVDDGTYTIETDSAFATVSSSEQFPRHSDPRSYDTIQITRVGTLVTFSRIITQTTFTMAGTFYIDKIGDPGRSGNIVLGKLDITSGVDVREYRTFIAGARVSSGTTLHTLSGTNQGTLIGFTGDSHWKFLDNFYKFGTYLDQYNSLITIMGGITEAKDGYGVRLSSSLGSSTHILIPSWSGAAANIWTITVEFDVPDLSAVTTILGGSVVGYLQVSTAGAVLVRSSSSVIFAQSSTGVIVPGQRHKLTVSSTSTSFVVNLDGSDVISTTQTTFTFGPIIYVNRSGSTIVPRISLYALSFQSGTYNESWITKTYSGNGSMWPSVSGTRSLTIFGQSNANAREGVWCIPQTPGHVARTMINFTKGLERSEFGTYYDSAAKTISFYHGITSSSVNVASEYTNARPMKIKSLFSGTVGMKPHYCNSSIYGIWTSIDNYSSTISWVPDGTAVPPNTTPETYDIVTTTGYTHVGIPDASASFNGVEYGTLSNIPWSTVMNTTDAVVEISGWQYSPNIKDLAGTSTKWTLKNKSTTGQFNGDLFSDDYPSVTFYQAGPGFDFIQPNRETIVEGIVFNLKRGRVMTTVAPYNNQHVTFKKCGLYYSGLNMGSSGTGAFFFGNQSASSSFTLEDIVIAGFPLAGVSKPVSGAATVTLNRVTIANINQYDVSSNSPIDGSNFTVKNSIAHTLSTTQRAVTSNLPQSSLLGVASNDGTGSYNLPISLSNDFINANDGDYRVRPTSRLYSAGIGAFTPAPNFTPFTAVPLSPGGAAGTSPSQLSAATEIYITVNEDGGLVIMRWNGSTFVPALLRRWNGVSWESVSVKRWTGLTWQ